MFPGLGEVRVSADGAIEVVTDGDDTCREALWHGWGRPLAAVRTGRHLLFGAVLAPPEPTTVAGAGATLTATPAADPPPALLVQGPVHQAASVLTGLVARGWSVLGDHLVPAHWDDDLGTYVADPTPSPVLMARGRAEASGLSAVKVRDDTNVVRVDVPRATRPHAVAAVAFVGTRGVGDVTLTEIVGLQRFDALGRLLAGGVLAVEVDLPPAQEMARRTRLARLPAVDLKFGEHSVDDDVEALLAWWADHAAGSHESRDPDAADDGHGAGR